jgi:hypothetical protein
VRDEFLRRHKLPKDTEWWGDVLCAPRALVGIEIDRALLGLKATLVGFGVPVASKFTVYTGDPDETLPVRAGGLEKAIQRDLAKLTTAVQRKAFAELCYEDPKRQAWLLRVAGR